MLPFPFVIVTSFRAVAGSQSRHFSMCTFSEVLVVHSFNPPLSDMGFYFVSQSPLFQTNKKEQDWQNLSHIFRLPVAQLGGATT